MELLERGANDRELRRLYGLGLTARQAARIVAEHGMEICAEIEQNPYRLIDLVSGYTFKKCDALALGNGGMDINNTDRLRAGGLYALSAIENRGHCAIPFQDFRNQVHYVLDFSLTSREAYKLLKSPKQGSVIQMKWGRKIYSISVADLSDALRTWEMSRQGVWNADPFRYVVDPIDDNLIDATLADLKSMDRLVIDRQNDVDYAMSMQYYLAENNIASCIRDFVATDRLPFQGVEATLNEILRRDGILYWRISNARPSCVFVRPTVAFSF